MTKPFIVDSLEFRSVKSAAEHFGVPYRTVQSRLRAGATIEEALGVCEPETRTCSWCEREWPSSNFDTGKSQCRGCRNLERHHGMTTDDVAAWVLHAEGPRCALCKEGFAENGGPLTWVDVYRGEETAGYRIPVCDVCGPVLRMSRERFGHQVGAAAGIRSRGTT